MNDERLTPYKPTSSTIPPRPAETVADEHADTRLALTEVFAEMKRASDRLIKKGIDLGLVTRGGK